MRDLTLYEAAPDLPCRFTEIPRRSSSEREFDFARYAPMARLLRESDFNLLRAAGRGRFVRLQRCFIYLCYVGDLRRDLSLQIDRWTAEVHEGHWTVEELDRATSLVHRALAGMVLS